MQPGSESLPFLSAIHSSFVLQFIIRLFIMSHKSNITFLGLALPPNHPALATHPSGGDGRYTPSRFAEDLKAMHVDVAKSRQ